MSELAIRNCGNDWQYCNGECDKCLNTKTYSTIVTSDSISTSEDYMDRMLTTEKNVHKVENALMKLGINVKTNYGNYRPLYDVLSDIAEKFYN